jgi:hypothetical protein
VADAQLSGIEFLNFKTGKMNRELLAKRRRRGYDSAASAFFGLNLNALSPRSTTEHRPQKCKKMDDTVQKCAQKGVETRAESSM